jgi:hypothetical protein
MVHKIAQQVPPGTTVQFHWNGEPLLYPYFGQAVTAFKHCITGMDTNGKLLLEKSMEIIGLLDTLTLSVIEKDPEAEEQEEILLEFLELKGDKKPQMVYRLLGNVDIRPWEELCLKTGGKVATRILHDPLGSWGYEKDVNIPEMGICLDMLHSIAIDRHGNVCHCVRLDQDAVRRNETPSSFIGHVNNATLEEIVNSKEEQQWHDHPRKRYIEHHVKGEREMVPLCRKCEFYGVPTPRPMTIKEKYKKPTTAVMGKTHGQFKAKRKVQRNAQAGQD